MKCPSCGNESNGNFCPACGASMRQHNDACVSCGAKLVPGARFCTKCGTRVGGSARTGASTGTAAHLPWYLAGGVLLVIAVALALYMVAGNEPEAAGPPVQNAPFAGTAPGAGTGTPPALSADPRENADRLYNRIMTAWSQGDSAEARRFTPMAIQAYGMVPALDDDGLYHLAMVQNVAGDYAAARATAEQLLAKNPDHLLALAAAIEATMPTDIPAARDYARRFLAAYDSERTKPIAEYLDHQRVLPDYQQMAQSLTQ